MQEKPVCIPINYIEFQVRDVAEAKQFYGSLFGWSFVDYGPDYASFEQSEAGIDGGFETTTGEIVTGSPLIVLYAKDLAPFFEVVKASGAEITREIFEFPGGKRFEFCDPSGNKLAVWSE